MATKHTIIYQSHFELMDILTDQQAGLLIKSIGLFQKDIEPDIKDPLVLGIFMAIKRDFTIQAENYEKKKEANRKNGKLGGRPSNPNNPLGLSITQRNPQNLKDRDIDKEKERPRSESVGSPQDEYLLIYQRINEADRHFYAKEIEKARHLYDRCLYGLETIKKKDPEWEPSIIRYRIKYLEQKLEEIDLRRENE